MSDDRNDENREEEDVHFVEDFEDRKIEDLEDRKNASGPITTQAAGEESGGGGGW